LLENLIRRESLARGFELIGRFFDGRQELVLEGLQGGLRAREDG
jgi:hypothetical protein